MRAFYNMINFFEENSNSRHTSLSFTDQGKKPASLFRGSIEDFIRNFSSLGKDVNTVQITGKKVAKGVYDSSVEINSEELARFFELAEERGIESIDFTGCTLQPKDGAIIGRAISKSQVIKDLHVTTSQLESKGMVELYKGIQSNRSLESLYGRSYNVARHYCSDDEIRELANLIKKKNALKTIALPDNQIKEEHIVTLQKAYLAVTNRNPAEIRGLVSCWGETEAFNHENALKGLYFLRRHRRPEEDIEEIIARSSVSSQAQNQASNVELDEQQLQKSSQPSCSYSFSG